MTDTRTITREQLGDAMDAVYGDEVDAKILDAIFAALPQVEPKPNGWHTYHICDGVLRELTILSTFAPAMPEQPALDVERLAAAKFTVSNYGRPAEKDWPDEFAKFGIRGFYGDGEWSILEAEAAEYARLTSATAEEA